jgi:hypothetical protein
MTADPQEDLCVLASLRTEVEAAMIRSALAEHGIDARLVGNYLAQFRGTEVAVEVQLLVRNADLSRARSILDTLSERPPTIDWSRVDVGAPEGAAVSGDHDGSA